MTRLKILKMDVDIFTLEEAVHQVLKLSITGQGGYVCFGNVHMCMESFDSTYFRDLVNQADLTLADGKPIAVAQKILGAEQAFQVRGPDVMDVICGISGKEKINIGLYGGESDVVLDIVVNNLQTKFDDINVTFSYSPPFRPLTDSEELEVVTSINSSEVNILFVGIGCPKQEMWMAKHKAQLNCVMLGVGAAFDYISGIKKEAPKWVQNIGMEWLFRLGTEPARLWQRYLKHNPRFIYYLLLQWLEQAIRK